MKKWLLMLACAFCAVSLSAAEMKIAVIDMGRVFQEYSKTKINEAKLKKQAEIFKDYSTRLSDQLKKLQEEFKDLRDASQNMAFTAAERENRRLNAADKYAQVTAKEKEKIQSKARKCGLSTTEYVKQRALGYEPKGIPPDALFVCLEKLDELADKASSPELDEGIYTVLKQITAAFLLPGKG